MIRERPAPQIPKSALPQGITTCLAIASLRLAEAETLLSNGFLMQAAIVFSFALEEFGKAALLREASQGSADPAIVEGFYDHRTKLAVAEKYLPSEYLLLKEAAFHPEPFQPHAVDVGMPADLEVRMASLYVEWRNGWRYNVEVDPGILGRSMAGVTAAIGEKMATWT